jgi:cyclic pyranopterin phosphate synthase
VLADTFGREARDLRVSLTDRCGLRCSYCMPAGGLAWLPREELLTDDELVRVVGLLVGAGIERIRLTGGEPLLRPSVIDVVARLGELSPRPEIALTSNGVGLALAASGLAAAGLDRVNVSLDTLRADRFLALTRRSALPAVLAGIRAAAAAGLAPVKVNTVLMRGMNDDEALDLLAFCLAEGYELRFIEQMPLDPQHQWDRAEMVTGEEILAQLRTRWTLSPAPGRGSAPAETWLVDGGPGRVGVVASVTAPFCSSCDRLRLTADGQLRTCLFARGETDLRGPLRAGASDAELLGIVESAVLGKAKAHGIDTPGFRQPDRPMSAIGG